MGLWPRMGTDESGKGDYFGPLVVAGVCVRDEAEAALLAERGIKDSKKVSDGRAKQLAAEVQRLCPCEVVRISPQKYNELYEKIGNLNKLLAWGHARVIENLLERVACAHVLSDQFGDERFLRSALMKKGSQVVIEQRPRAEEDIAVAAASIVARAHFLRDLEALSRRCGISLPKGATHVKDVARQVVVEKGKDELGQVAKLHFRSTKQVLAEVGEGKA